MEVASRIPNNEARLSYLFLHFSIKIRITHHLLQFPKNARTQGSGNLEREAQGRNWIILRGGRRTIYDRKDEIIHGHSLSIKCVAPLVRDMSLAKD